MIQIFLEHLVLLSLETLMHLSQGRGQLLNEFCLQTIVPEGQDTSQLPHEAEVFLLSLKVKTLKVPSDPLLQDDYCIIRRKLNDWCLVLQDYLGL